MSNMLFVRRDPIPLLITVWTEPPGIASRVFKRSPVTPGPRGRTYGETIPVRLTTEMITAIDKWAARIDLSRSEAIRLLVEVGLAK